jgi:predicted metal-binding membrane protein
VATTFSLRPSPDVETPGTVLRMLERRVTFGTVGVLVGLAAVAWVVTVQQAVGMSAMVTGLAQVGTGMPNPVDGPVFLGMWLTMMVAMMFPTMGPTVLAHRLVVRQRGEGMLPTLAFVFGYLVVWTAIGLVPLVIFLGVRDLPMVAPVARWLPRLSGVALIGAGLYQFTPWKGACLRACRSPIAFILTHDFGRGARGAGVAGVSNGAYCVGCCWALMTVLVIVGLMNLVWMAALALVFLAEKNWQHGARLNRLAGASIVVLGLIILVNPSVLLLVSGAGSGTGM